MGADNQQERLDAAWIAGFVDGEGCFHVAINRQQKMTLGWQVLPELRIVQHQRDESILHKIRNFFGCGVVRVNNGDRMELRIRGLKDLNHIVEFFEEHPLQTTKRTNFDKFATIVRLMNNNEHLTLEGLQSIDVIATSMNKASRILRDYTPDISVEMKI